jgi:hypothetical protein
MWYVVGGLLGAVAFVLGLLGGEVSARQTALFLLLLVSAVVGLVTTRRGR